MSAVHFTGGALNQAAAQGTGGIPGIVSRKNSDSFDNWRYRIQQFKLTEPGDVSELERIRTKTLGSNPTIIWQSQKEFLFMDTILLLAEYLELID